MLAINKMDLVDYDKAVFDRIQEEFTNFAAKLDITDLTVIPMSALKGDNIVTRSENMPWYDGSSLLHHLENVHVASDRNLIDARFPVQYVIRPQSDRYHDYRGYAGTVAGGVFKPGDDVVVLPSGFTTKIKSIDTADGPVDEAFPPMAVTIRLEDNLDVSRGDMICRPHNAPTPVAGPRRDDLLDVGDADAARPEVRDQAHDPDAPAAWSRTCSTGSTSTRCTATRRPPTSASTRSAGSGCAPRCRCSSTRTAATATTGGFVLIDEATNRTVAAGMVTTR